MAAQNSVRSFGTVGGIAQSIVGFDQGTTPTDADLVAGNIKKDVNILGIIGTLQSMTTDVSSGTVVSGYTSLVSAQTTVDAGSGMYRTASASTAAIGPFTTSAAKNGIVMRSNPTSGSFAIGTNYACQVNIVSTSYNWGGTGIYLLSNTTGEYVLISNASGLYNEGSSYSYLLSITAFFASPGKLKVFTVWGGASGTADRTDYTAKDVGESFFAGTVQLVAVAGGSPTDPNFSSAYSNSSSSTYSCKVGFYGKIHTF